MHVQTINRLAGVATEPAAPGLPASPVPRTQHGKVTEIDVASEELAADIRKHIQGEVRFDKANRALYATDGSNYRFVPIGVVIPRTKEDVIETVAACRRFGAPILARGGGTSLAGNCCNAAVIMDLSKYMHHILEIDTQRRLGRVMPGCVLDDFRFAAEKAGQLTFGPDPATHNHCCLGGMLGNNSCGIHSLLCRKSGNGLRTSDNTHELEVLTYDGLRMRVGKTPPEELERIVRAGGRRGQIYADMKALVDRNADLIRARYPKIPRRVSGYNLDELLPENGFNVARALVGSEATLVTILEATMNLVHSPPVRSLLVLGYPDIYSAGDHVMEILKYGPTGLEGVDELLFRYEEMKGAEKRGLRLLPPGCGWLLVEFGGDTKEQADADARRCMEELKKQPNPPSMKLFDNPKEEEYIWQVRESSLGSTALVPGLPDTWEGFEDSAVPPERVGGYLRDLRKLMDKFNYKCSLYGHLGQGCIHCRIPFDLYSAEGVKHYARFMDEATDLVVRYGGSISGEHGDGQARAEFLPKMFGEELVQAFREFKRIWDPEWKMNPGKVVDPYSITENLRLGPNYNPPQLDTHFKYPNDKSAFSRAALRCVGVGLCRAEGKQTMCPSYMVTREEMHSTRGRARMLWEMLNGSLRDEGWGSEGVKEALDLCLSCKGCKHDCPVNVDMATYKAEFLSHYFKRHARPRHAYAFGLIPYWVEAAALAPELVNFMTHAPGLSSVAKWIAGMAPQRTIPRFAPETFRAWFERRPKPTGRRQQVLLYADTFNNHFKPETAKAAVEVLESAGFEVKVPRQHLCCGRPLYDYGMLDLAKQFLQRNMKAMRGEIRASIPMVVLEPSCCAVFRDELTNIFPALEDAKRLNDQTFLLSEFLTEKVPGYKPPPLKREGLIHGHCHHKSLMGMDAESNLLEQMGLRLSAPETGCCGMAGAFGYEQGDHYDVSIKCGERVLLPSVRETPRTSLIIADGFSCKEQIEQTTDRKALHLAQVIQMALHEGEQGPSGELPEQKYTQPETRTERRARRRRTFVSLALGVGLGAIGLMLFGSARSRTRK